MNAIFEISWWSERHVQVRHKVSKTISMNLNISSDKQGKQTWIFLKLFKEVNASNALYFISWIFNSITLFLRRQKTSLETWKTFFPSHRDLVKLIYLYGASWALQFRNKNKIHSWTRLQFTYLLITKLIMLYF